MVNIDSGEERWRALALEASRVFQPNTPIDERALFAGREAQVRRVVDAVNQKGLHAIIFGERGVGKTSLANVLSQFLSYPTLDVLAPRVTCAGAASFDHVWRMVFDQIDLLKATPAVGFRGKASLTPYSATQLLGDEEVTPDRIRRTLTIMSRDTVPILIVDEFDRLAKEPRRLFADTIKSLSDHAVPATVVLVGVADSVDQLIDEHESVARALVQIQMPRMSSSEITTIVTTGLQKLGMSIEDEALEKIALLSQGLPHYAHLLGLHASRAALDGRAETVTVAAIDHAVAKAIKDAQQSIRTAYHEALRSPRKDSLFGDVLLACALAKQDELGFFAAQDVRSPLRAISGRNYEIPSFARHLSEFTDEKRCRILMKTGEKWRYRYRFRDPLMQPFVIMQGVVSRKIPTRLLNGQER